jgi:hypothetical protein
MKADIKIQIKGEKESARDFIRAWKQAEKGIIPEEPGKGAPAGPSAAPG